MMVRLFFGVNMARVTIYDTSNGDVLAFMKSAHTPDYQGRPDAILRKRPPAGVPMRFWKVEAGDIREMTEAEKDDKRARLRAARDDQRRTDADNLDVEGKAMIRALRRLGALAKSVTDQEIADDIKQDEGL